MTKCSIHFWTTILCVWNKPLMTYWTNWVTLCNNAHVGLTVWNAEEGQDNPNSDQAAWCFILCVITVIITRDRAVSVTSFSFLRDLNAFLHCVYIWYQSGCKGSDYFFHHCKFYWKCVVSAILNYTILSQVTRTTHMHCFKNVTQRVWCIFFLLQPSYYHTTSSPHQPFTSSH